MAGYSLKRGDYYEKKIHWMAAGIILSVILITGIAYFLGRSGREQQPDAQVLNRAVTPSLSVPTIAADGNASPSDSAEPIAADTIAEEPEYYSNLPVIYIDTENHQTVDSKDIYINATAKIYGNDSMINMMLYEGSIQIRGRGNSTWMVAKKPYKIKLETKTDLFGKGKNKHWVLLANYYDQSLMRNMLALEFAKKMGFTAPEFESVDLVMNGIYVGNYLLCNQVEISKDLVDIFDWEEATGDIAKKIVASDETLTGAEDELKEVLEKNLNWITSGTFTYDDISYEIEDYYKLPDISGGYLLELDDTYDEVSKFKTSSGQPIMFKSPEYAYTNQEMFGYVSSYVQAFEDAVKSKDFTVKYEGKKVRYSELGDMDSLVDF